MRLSDLSEDFSKARKSVEAIEKRDKKILPTIVIGISTITVAVIALPFIAKLINLFPNS